MSFLEEAAHKILHNPHGAFKASVAYERYLLEDVVGTILLDTQLRPPSHQLRWRISIEVADFYSAADESYSDPREITKDDWERFSALVNEAFDEAERRNKEGTP